MLPTYKTKIELASSIITELIDFGFKIKLVLADSLYGEASSFIRTLENHKLAWVVAIRSNHGVWLPPEQKVRANKWCKFQRTFSNQKAVRPRADVRRKGTRTKTSEIRYIREIIFGN